MSLRQQKNQSRKISLSIPLEHALFDVVSQFTVKVEVENGNLLVFNEPQQITI